MNANNQVVIAGTGAAPGLPQPPASGNAPLFVVTLNQSASQAASGVYLTMLNQGAVPSGLAMDASGNLFILGTTDVGSDFTATPGAYFSPAPITNCTTNEFDIVHQATLSCSNSMARPSRRSMPESSALRVESERAH